jgi:hypothetical protein
MLLCRIPVTRVLPDDLSSVIGDIYVNESNLPNQSFAMWLDASEANSFVLS